MESTRRAFAGTSARAPPVPEAEPELPLPPEPEPEPPEPLPPDPDPLDPDPVLPEPDPLPVPVPLPALIPAPLLAWVTVEFGAMEPHPARTIEKTRAASEPAVQRRVLTVKIQAEKFERVLSGLQTFPAAMPDIIRSIPCQGFSTIRFLGCS